MISIHPLLIQPLCLCKEIIIFFHFSKVKVKKKKWMIFTTIVNGGGGDKFHTPQHAINFKHNTPYINVIFQNLTRGYESIENTSFMFNANV